jgi:hypothetical protein
MSVEVSLPEHLFARLQKLATPLVDTPASVIEKLLDYYEERHGRVSPEPPNANSRLMDPEHPDDLRHTRVLHASFCGEKAGNWNELLQVAHRVAFRKASSYDALRLMTIANIVSGEKTDSGFVFLRDIGISIQNVESNKCWRDALHLGKNLNGNIEVTLQWRDKEGAAHPGEVAVMRWPSH